MKHLSADYQQAAATAVVVADPRTDSLAEVSAQLDAYGFAIAQLPTDLGPQQAIELIADRWALGTPYVPRIYRMPGAEQFGGKYADIKADASAAHPGFGVRAAQGFHVDGTLDDPGAVRTVVMYCVHPADEGGRSLVFNSTAAFAELRLRDPDAAAVLQHENVLRRVATIRGIDAHRDGPAFIVGTDTAIVNRYCDDVISTYRAAADSAAALDRGLAFLRAASRTGSRYRATVLLTAHQCLVLRNDWVSHAREAYQDRPEAPRHLIRAIYAATPR